VLIEECIGVKCCHDIDGHSGAHRVANPYKGRKYNDKPFIREYDKTSIDLTNCQFEK
jgi:hypothetical protein